MPHAPSLAALLLSGLLAAVGCHTQSPEAQLLGQEDEIIVAGQRFHTGTKVITWLDRDGYNGYLGTRPPQARKEPKALEGTQALPLGGKNLAALQQFVDQFVLHYDGHGLSKICFSVLQERALSVHFMLDLDGTVYQTLDLQERALHATISNDRSIGLEIANLGVFPLGETKPLDEWYRRDAHGKLYIEVPANLGDPKIYTKAFIPRPARPELITGLVQGAEVVQYDITREQYAALIKLTATLCHLFPRIKCDYPRDESGKLITGKLSDDQLARYEGILGHFHIQTNKTDPGPAVQWDRLIHGARDLLK